MPVKRTTSAETSARFLERYDPSPRVRRYRRGLKVERCDSCGGSAFVDAIDNFGNRYRGCATCRIKRPQPSDRIKLDMARATVAEALDCVSARINDCHARGVDPDHITNVAWSMLNNALTGEA